MNSTPPAASPPTPKDRPRCQALTRQGAPCRNGPLPGTSPPLCRQHFSPRHDARSSARCCTATRVDGAPCRHWALRGLDARLCIHHATLRGLWPRHRRCRARNRRGHRCSRWAATEAAYKGLCTIHARQQGLFKPRRRCRKKTAQGLPCQSPVITHTGPPLCAAHAGVSRFEKGHLHRFKHGYYVRDRFSAHEIARMQQTARELTTGAFTLGPEIDLCRLIVRRLLAATLPEHDHRASPDDYTRRVELVFRGLTTIALLRLTQARLENLMRQMRARQQAEATGDPDPFP